MPESKLRVLILGGTGLVGSSLARVFTAREDDVFIADLRSKPEVPGHFLRGDAVREESLGQLIREVRPSVVLNAVSIATIFSGDRRDGYDSLLRYHLGLYKVLDTVTWPLTFVHIGTTGTGGLGLDIPFTHGESTAELAIIHKAAFAGISTQLLFLMRRTFDPSLIRIIEFKPGLAIFAGQPTARLWEGVRLVTIDGGESGDYSLDEFGLVTSFMKSASDDYVAGRIVQHLVATAPFVQAPQYNITEAISMSVMDDSEDSGEFRQLTLRELHSQIGRNTRLIATGNLGPPEITLCLLAGAALLSSAGIADQSLQYTLAYLAEHRSDMSRELSRSALEARMRHLESCIDSGTVEPWQVLRNALIVSGTQHQRMR